tara:strand:+ start:58 stop:1086 length:1029 start_codon:yes stop_codon:yes gene_type:complete
MTKLSIIIPIYNEAEIIGKFLKKLQSTFKDVECKYIFIDDGSIDGTSEILKSITSNLFNNKNYKEIRFNKNYGKAYAVKKGIEYIEGEHTLLIDSDLEYDPKDALELYENALSNQDINVIQGSRYFGVKVKSRKYFFNDIAVRINTFLFNFLFNQSITDLHTGTKIIKSDLLKKLDLSFSRFGLEIDINSQIAKKNINIFEYGISYIERSKIDGKKITLIDGLLAYYFLFKARFIQNDYTTNLSILYAFSFMTYAGTFFGLGIGKILITIIFSITGLYIGLKRKILPLSLIFFSIYIGSLFSKGNGRIFPIFLFFLISLYISKKISQRYENSNKNIFMKFLI